MCRNTLVGFWASNPDWRSRERRDAAVGKHFGETAVPEGKCGPCPVFALYPGIRLTAEEKSWKTLSQASRKVSAGHDSISRLGGHINRLTNEPKSHLTIQFVPRSKHTPSRL